MRLKEGFSVPKLVELSGVPRRTIQDLEARGDGRISTAIKLPDYTPRHMPGSFWQRLHMGLSSVFNAAGVRLNLRYQTCAVLFFCAVKRSGKRLHRKKLKS